MAQPFNAATAQTTGDAIPLAEHLDAYPYSYLTRGLFSVSGNGVLVYSSGGAGTSTQLTWFDRSGKPLGTVGPPGDVNWPTLSPDEKTVAVFRNNPQTGGSDVWLHDVSRGSSGRLTSHPRATNYFPVWSPDGAYVAYDSNWEGTFKTYRQAASGAGSEEVLCPASMRADDWSRDGRYLILEGIGLWVQPLFGDGQRFQFLPSEFRVIQGRISPDSHWLVTSPTAPGATRSM
jgi:dipeptidyl aminopeptidase/acylaminoacyl peptidase